MQTPSSSSPSTSNTSSPLWRRRVLGLTMALAFATTIAPVRLSRADSVTDWFIVPGDGLVAQYSLFSPINRKRQIIDIVDLGDDRLVVSWMGSDRCIYSKTFDIPTNYTDHAALRLRCLGGSPDTADIGWLRAVADAPPTGAVACAERLGWLSFHAWDVVRNETRVVVDRVHNWPCAAPPAAITHELIDIGPGSFSAIARTPPNDEFFTRTSRSALVVWLDSQRTQILGKFIGANGTPGAQFTVYAPTLAPGQYLATPDIHFNTVSRRFIVGFASGAAPERSLPCRYFNLLLDQDGVVVRAPLQWGIPCDNSANGARQRV